MESYKTRTGSVCTLDKEIAQGGEGVIYTILGNNNQVAKIYKDPEDANRHESKLTTMLKWAGNSGLIFTAWPKELLYNPETNEFAGFLMDRISSNLVLSECYEIYGEADYNWHERIIIAYNLCFVVNGVHSIKQVCGDLNPRNICINLDEGKLYLLDADSFQIIDEDKIFRCTVAMQQYIPSEILTKMDKGTSLADIQEPVFTEDSDNFALAIHIFQLLMNGCHPFANALANLDDDEHSPPDFITAIVNGQTPFFKSNPWFTTPAYAPKTTDLPPYIQDLFRRAFVDSYEKGPSFRPTPNEWMNALKRMVDSDLCSCSKDRSHIYYRGLSSCPWCRLNASLNAVESKVSAISNEAGFMRNIPKSGVPPLRSIGLNIFVSNGKHSGLPGTIKIKPLKRVIHTKTVKDPKPKDTK